MLLFGTDVMLTEFCYSSFRKWRQFDKNGHTLTKSDWSRFIHKIISAVSEIYKISDGRLFQWYLCITRFVYNTLWPVTLWNRCWHSCLPSTFCASVKPYFALCLFFLSRRGNASVYHIPRAISCASDWELALYALRHISTYRCIGSACHPRERLFEIAFWKSNRSPRVTIVATLVTCTALQLLLLFNWHLRSVHT